MRKIFLQVIVYSCQYRSTSAPYAFVHVSSTLYYISCWQPRQITHTDTDTHTQTHIHRHTYTQKHIHTDTDTNTGTHTHTHTHRHNHKHTDRHTHRHTLTHTHTHTHTHTVTFNPLNAELNPICHLLALLGAHHILHVSRIRVNQCSMILCLFFPKHNTIWKKVKLLILSLRTQIVPLFQGFCSVPTRKIVVEYLKLLTAVFKLLSSSPFTKHTNTWPYTLWDVDSAMK